MLKRDLQRYYESARCKNILQFLGIFLQAPAIWAIIAYRIGATIRIDIIKTIYIFLVWNPIKIITGIEIYPQTKIGERFYIRHFGGIFINPRAIIGKNCTIFNGVTIGTKIGRKEAPVIGDNVIIATGAKVIGKINIGSNVTIGAGSVVTKDIEPGVTVAGNPATVIKKS